MPNLVKIGFTKNTPDGRAVELANATGVPSKFIVEYWAICKYPELIERKLHQSLDFFRVSNNREFFKCSVEEVVSQLYQLDATIFEEHGRIPYSQKAQAKLHRLALEKKAEEYRRNQYRIQHQKQLEKDQRIQQIEYDEQRVARLRIIFSIQMVLLIPVCLHGLFMLDRSTLISSISILTLGLSAYTIYVTIKLIRLHQQKQHHRSLLDQLNRS